MKRKLPAIVRGSQHPDRFAECAKDFGAEAG